MVYGQTSGDDDDAPVVFDVCDCPREYTERERENAVLIVLTCNTHGELLALLKRINEAFYVKGTRKALLSVMAETKPLIAQIAASHPLGQRPIVHRPLQRVSAVT